MRFSTIKRVKNCSLVHVALATVLAMSLGCSSAAGSNEGGEREAPLELPEALHITVRNATDQVQYIDEPGFWMRSASEQVVDFDGGYIGPPMVPALYTNQPTCQGIMSGEWGCGDHGDRGFTVRALAPGAEYTEEWDAQAWERSSLEGDPDCSCMESVKAPAGDYLVSLRVSSSVTCFNPDDCACEPGDGSCIGSAEIVDPEPLERPVTWPEQGEVLLVIE
jgi:hypothetical protein